MTRTRLGSRKREPSPDILQYHQVQVYGHQRRQRAQVFIHSDSPLWSSPRRGDNGTVTKSYKEPSTTSSAPNEYTPKHSPETEVLSPLGPLYDEIADFQTIVNPNGYNDFDDEPHIVPDSNYEPYTSTPISAYEIPGPLLVVPQFIRFSTPEHKRPGIMHSIKMWNIVSHFEFFKKWHHSRNYIIGDNGSGKSSLMVGIRLALGVKAASVGKKTIKDCINYNAKATVGRVEITLTHGGELDPNRYGDFVTICRVIEMNGISKYQVRTADEKWRSLGRHELNRILLTLQIMVDNPLQFLTQNVASRFLQVTDSKLVYNYFDEATGLAPCKKLTEQTRADLDYARKMMMIRDENIKELQLDAANKKRDVQEVIGMRDLKDKLMANQREYAWSNVIQLEKDQAVNKAELDKTVEKIKESKRKLIECGERKAELEKSFEADSILLRNLMGFLHSNQEERDRRNSEAEQIKRNKKALTIQITCLTNSIRNESTQLAQLQRKVEALERDRNENFEKRKREMDAQRIQLTDTINTLRASLTEATNDNATVQSEVQRLVAEHNEQLGMIKMAQQRIETRQRELKNINQVKKSQYDRFGPEMVLLMEKIHANKHKFQVVPKGPQGACYTVKDEFKDYAPIIEYAMYSTINSFKVTSQHDQNLLHALMDEVYGSKKGQNQRQERPNLFWSMGKAGAPVKEKAYDVRLVAPSKESHFLLQMLDIVDNDPSVINWLIDSKGVERILMFPDVPSACVIMKNKNRVPKNCNVGYTKDFRVVNPVPGYRIMSKKVNKKANFVQVTSSTQFSNRQELLQRDIQELKAEHAQLKADCETQRARLNEKNGTYHRGEKERKRLTNALVIAEKQLSSLGGTSNNTSDIDSYKDEIEYFTTSVKQREEEKLQLSLQIADLEPALRAAVSAVAAMEEEIKQAQNQKYTIESRTSVVGETNRLQRDEEKLKSVISALDLAEKKFKDKARELEVLLQEKTTDAQKLSHRVETERDGDTIKKETDSLLSILKKNKYKIAQLGAMESELKKAEKIVKEQVTETEILKKLMTCVEQMANLREKHFDKVKLNYGISVTTNFEALIATRNYKGEIHVDHEDRTLTYYVCPDSNSEANMKRNFKIRDDGNYKLINKKGIKDFMAGLSGGERSFSTFCFMVSLWNVMEAPFYMLDEFEIYMDNHHRAKCHQILRDHARNQPGAQFFFFTPIEMESMPSPHEACVLRLQPPIRDAVSGKRVADEEDEVDLNPKKKARPGLNYRPTPHPPIRVPTNGKRLMDDEADLIPKRKARQFY